nr:MAG TPA: hypothetical protein [Caudoviricetes sp.]
MRRRPYRVRVICQFLQFVQVFKYTCNAACAALSCCISTHATGVTVFCDFITDCFLNCVHWYTLFPFLTLLRAIHQTHIHHPISCGKQSCRKSRTNNKTRQFRRLRRPSMPFLQVIKCFYHSQNGCAVFWSLHIYVLKWCPF